MRYRTELIKKPQSGDDRYFGDVNTKGIIDVVLYADPRSGEYTREFAKTLKAAKLFDTCKNIYEFVKSQIPYVLDKQGYQWIKSPGRLWAEKAGDCKSFSVFIASCLKNLGIPYGYRFASYDKADPTPTHVYIYVPVGNKELILDAVWSGPFNTQKQYEHKQDYPMAKTSYLGTAGKHIPGVLRIDTPIEDLTDGELDLLLLKQKLEIKKMNAGIAGVGAYDEALKTIDHCIRNVGNPDLIIGIGEALEEGLSLEEAITGIGASAKKTAKKAARAEKKKTTGKTAAGRLLQKVGKGLKNAGKAVVKVVTAPMRLIAKGAMEIYLPKAAPFFLYLFAPNPEKLPDMMKRKRLKAEKFKNFVVKGIGMKENHFMQIISNNLEKRYKMPPAQYLAEKLATRVSGIGNPKARWRAETDRVIAGIAGPKKPARKAVKPKPVKKLKPAAKPGFNSTLKTITTAAAALPLNVRTPDFTAVQNQQAANMEAAQAAQAEDRANTLNTLADVGAKAASGDVLGAVMGAITWLIQKISALFGNKEKMDPIGPDDLPDVERDAANAFEFQDLRNDYGNLSQAQQSQTKMTVAEAIARGLSVDTAQEFITSNLPFLDNNQRMEMVEEVASGPEALDESEGLELAKELDPEGSTNNTGLIVLAAVAALAISKS